MRRQSPTWSAVWGQVTAGTAARRAASQSGGAPLNGSWRPRRCRPGGRRGGRSPLSGTSVQHSLQRQCAGGWSAGRAGEARPEGGSPAPRWCHLGCPPPWPLFSDRPAAPFRRPASRGQKPQASSQPRALATGAEGSRVALVAAAPHPRLDLGRLGACAVFAGHRLPARPTRRSAGAPTCVAQGGTRRAPKPSGRRRATLHVRRSGFLAGGDVSVGAAPRVQFRPPTGRPAPPRSSAASTVNQPGGRSPTHQYPPARPLCWRDWRPPRRGWGASPAGRATTRFVRPPGPRSSWPRRPTAC